MLFDRVVRWRPYRTRGTIAEVLFWFAVTAPAALALGLARSVATRPWIGLAGCGALWWITRVPGVLPASSMAGTAALVLPAVFLCVWFCVGALLAVGPTGPGSAPAIATRGARPATRAAPAASP